MTQMVRADVLSSVGRRSDSTPSQSVPDLKRDKYIISIAIYLTNK